MGHVPDGVYNFIGNTIELLNGPLRVVAELQRLADILKNAKANQISKIFMSTKQRYPFISD